MRRWAYKWQVLTVAIFGSFMAVLDATVVNVALPTLERELRTGVAGVQWILTSYLMTLGIVTPVAGYLADRYGIKRMYIATLALFGVGSALCGLATGLWQLVLFRVVQGVGGGAIVPLAISLMFSSFPPEERGFANGIFGIPLLVAPALGPTVGGWIIDHFHWSWIFFINVPIGVVGVLWAWRTLRPDETRSVRRFDFAGLVLSSLGLGALLYGLSQGAEHGWTSPRILASLGLGAAAVAVFAWVDLRRDDPIVDLHLFKRATFRRGSIANWVAVMGLFGPAFLLPLYLQNLRHLGAFDTGLLLVPQALAAAVVIPFTGRLYDRIGARLLVIVGMAILAVTTWYFARLRADASLWLIGGLLAARGVALGCVIQPTTNTALSDVTNPEMSRASSLVSATRNVVQSFSVGVVATALAWAARSSGSFLDGFDFAFRVVLWTNLLGLVVGFLLPGWPGQRAVKRRERPGGASAARGAHAMA